MFCRGALVGDYFTGFFPEGVSILKDSKVGSSRWILCHIVHLCDKDMYATSFDQPTTRKSKGPFNMRSTTIVSTSNSTCSDLICQSSCHLLPHTYSAINGEVKWNSFTPQRHEKFHLKHLSCHLLKTVTRISLPKCYQMLTLIPSKSNAYSWWSLNWPH